MPSEKKMAKCQNWNLRVHGNSLMKILFEKILFFHRFWTFKDNIPASCRKFLGTLSALLFSCPTEHFEEFFFGKNLFYLFLQGAKKIFFAFCRKKSLARYPIWRSWRPESQFEEELFLFWNKTAFSNAFVYWEKILELKLKSFRQCCQECILCVHGNNLRKKNFLWEKNFFINFGYWAMCLPLLKFSKVDLSKLHSKCPIVFRGKFLLESVYCHFGTLI